MFLPNAVSILEQCSFIARLYLTVIITTFECMSLSERFEAPPKYLLRTYIAASHGIILMAVHSQGTESMPSTATFEMNGIGIVSQVFLRWGSVSIKDTFHEHEIGSPKGERGVVADTRT